MTGALNKSPFFKPEIEQLKKEKKTAEDKLEETEKKLKNSQQLTRTLSCDLERYKDKKSSFIGSAKNLVQRKILCAGDLPNKSKRYSQVSELDTIYDNYEVKE